MKNHPQKREAAVAHPSRRGPRTPAGPDGAEAEEKEDTMPDRSPPGAAGGPRDSPGPVERRAVFRSGGGLRWRRVFPGAEAQLRELRRWVTGLLPDSAARGDVLTVAVELAANALRHSASGRPGGCFAAELTWYGPSVRIAVADGGGPGEPRVLDRPYGDELDGFDEHGRGLTMVEALAARTGVIGDARGRVVWAEVRWPAEHAPDAAVFDGVHEDTIATAEQALRVRFSEFLTWFGRETPQWWACGRHADTTAPGLVHAPSAAELEELLTRVRLGVLAAERMPDHHRRSPPPHPAR
jgi:anti-sigma regulatory factor (Ser/Thr protein kinase)